jgi:hypothetical protein
MDPTISWFCSETLKANSVPVPYLDPVELLVASQEIKRHYLGLANTVQRLHTAVLPDPARAFAGEVTLVQVIAEKILALTPEEDISLISSRWKNCSTVPSPQRGILSRNSTGTATLSA